MTSYTYKLCACLCVIAVSGCQHLSPPLPTSPQTTFLECNANESFAKVLTLANGTSLVVREGMFEPRSIGTITVILYRDLNVGQMSSGMVFSRDGVITDATLDKAQIRLTITTATAGSGNYTHHYRLCIDDDNQLDHC
ncbi:PliI family lysozyme inhibitor of I-type lysozyme [Shewanella sp. NIFS-20-20]|uniref:PliI family lysozyme inhibitor of I-type lysozyme n=1 Tax=Shewanella sp. NIFS-20-20 TaxID=2853806 RepID=UPI001C45A43D|nr:PliI family lysozyme inhibitor of I-type lysozyme [Shewanella sp. NIFS-20-20]MBV7314570.1 PliI family lysozyme inhibitor of I-type lysozyme [Shewanella sp. NIFS-20-20]